MVPGDSSSVGQLSARPVPPHQSPARPLEGDHGVVASILTATYHVLKDGTMYHDFGCDHFKRHSTDQQKKRLVKRLSELGYAVEFKPLAA
jgi:transposase